MGKPALLLFAMCALAAATAVAAMAEDINNAGICNVKVSELVECLPAITGKSPPKPTRSCCGVMSKANLHCLCKYKSRLGQLGVDPANALALPRKCGLRLPAKCNSKY